MNDWQSVPCKPWQGQCNSKGYGRIHTARKTRRLAHRVAFEKAYGPIPPGMDVCHHCDNPPCVEPLHLFLGTRSENMQDMVAKGRHAGKNKTHCVHGHEYTPENTTTHVNARGYTLRECRTCIRERTRARRQTEQGKAARLVERQRRREKLAGVRA